VGIQQGPNESNKDFRKRQQEYDRELLRKRNAKERADRDKAIQDRMDRDAELDNMVADAELPAVLNELGLSVDDFQRAFDITEPGEIASWDQRDKKILEGYQKAQKQGWLESKKSRNQRVAKYLRKNKRKVKDITKKHGKKKGWFW
jgi:hypothetical protein